MSEHRFVCAECGEEKVHVNPNGCGGTGYGIDRAGNKVCYACCGKHDLADMRETGRAVLYLTEEGTQGTVVSNWPGTLKIRVTHLRKGSHNIAGSRTDVWFTDGDGRQWHGVQLGEFSQLCRCKRLKAA